MKKANWQARQLLREWGRWRRLNWNAGLGYARVDLWHKTGYQVDDADIAAFHNYLQEYVRVRYEKAYRAAEVFFSTYEYRCSEKEALTKTGLVVDVGERQARRLVEKVESIVMSGWIEAKRVENEIAELMEA